MIFFGFLFRSIFLEITSEINLPTLLQNLPWNPSEIAQLISLENTPGMFSKQFSINFLLEVLIKT